MVVIASLLTLFSFVHLIGVVDLGMSFVPRLVVSTMLSGIAAFMFSDAEAAEKTTKQQGRVQANQQYRTEVIEHTRGLYIGGHPSIPESGAVYFARDAQSVLILDDQTNAIRGRIPRGALTRVQVTDATTVDTLRTQRVTVTRLAVLGPLALAAPQKRDQTVTHAKFHVSIEWFATGMQHCCLLEFADSSDASRVNSFIASSKTLATV